MIRLKQSLLLLIFFIQVISLSALDNVNCLYQSQYLHINGKESIRSFAIKLGTRMSERIENLQIQLGIYISSPATIEIVTDRNSFSRLVRNHEKIVQSSLAFYSAKENTIYIRGPEQIQIEENYANIILHEYIHWYLDAIFNTAPLWFHEGMAVYYSGQFNYQYYYNFTRAVFFSQIDPLSTMSLTYPTQNTKWQNFYLTSVFAVIYLQRKYPVAWDRFWNNIGITYAHNSLRPVSFPLLFESSFPFSADYYSEIFSKGCREYAWQYLIVGINGVIFSVLPVILIIVWLIKRKRSIDLPDDIEYCPDCE